MTTYIQYEFISVYGGEFAFWGEPVADNPPTFMEEDKMQQSDFNSVSPGQLILLGVPGQCEHYKYVGEQLPLFDTSQYSGKIKTKFKWVRSKKSPRTSVKGFNVSFEYKQLVLLKVKKAAKASNRLAFLAKNAKKLAAKRERQARGAANHEMSLLVQQLKKENRIKKHNRLEARRQAKAVIPALVSYEARRRAFLDAKSVIKKGKTRKIKPFHGLMSWPRIGRRLASRLATRHYNPIEYLPNGVVVVPQALSPKELRLWRDYGLTTRQARIESARYLGLLPTRDNKPKLKTPKPVLKRNKYNTLSWGDEGHSKKVMFGVGYKKPTPKFESVKPNPYKKELLVQLGEVPVLKKDQFKKPPRKKNKPNNIIKLVQEEQEVKPKYVPAPPKDKTKKVKAKKKVVFNAFAEDDSPKKKGKGQGQGKSSKNKCRKAGRSARKGTMFSGENSILGKKALKEYFTQQPVVSATVLNQQSEKGGI